MKVKELQYYLIFLAFSIFLSACSNSNFSGTSAANGFQPDSESVEEDAQGENIPSYEVSDSVIVSPNIDLVIALDTSGSMREEKQAVENNLNQLMLSLLESNLSPLIHVIAQGRSRNILQPNRNGFVFTPDIDPNRVALVDQAVGSHDALSHVTRLLSGLYSNRYKDVTGMPMATPLEFRADAKLEILIISDDNGKNRNNNEDYSNLAKDFDPENRWQATVSGIVGLPDSNEVNGVCSVVEVGQEYITLAQQTGGSILDICSPDWTELLQRFSADIIQRSHSIKLSQLPDDLEKIVVSLGGEIIDSDNWSYDPDKNLLTLASSIVVKAGMELQVNYTAKP